VFLLRAAQESSELKKDLLIEKKYLKSSMMVMLSLVMFAMGRLVGLHKFSL
jgi:hypothetical protein